VQRIACILALLSAGLFASTARSAGKPVQLILDQDNTIAVGQLAVMHIPSDNQYSWVSGPNAAWRDKLALVHRSRHDVTFRAIHPGRVVIILSATGPGGCISCATRHLFLTILAANPSEPAPN
jgi:hypothetical protein